MIEPDKVEQYLSSICKSSQDWWKPFAFIDEIDDTTWFEFGLKVIPPKQKGKNQQEQEENLPKPVLSALDECAREPVLVVGSPGAGKSTFLAKALFEAAQLAQTDSTAPIPVLVSLSLYDESGIWGLVQTSLEIYGLYLDVAEIKQLVEKNRLLLLADGVNELTEERARRKLKEFCRRKIPMIFTTRDLGGDLGIEHKLEIQSLSFTEVETFLHDRLSRQDQKRVQELCDRVKDFGQTPLMVWMLYSIFQGTGEIPTTRGEAYRAFTTLYAERAKEGIDLDESRSLLAKLAFEMMHSDKPTEPRFDISEVDAQNLLGSEKIFKYLLKYHLIQRFKDPKKPYRVRFCHQTLQEYYAAEELLKKLPKLSDAELKRDYLNYLKWTEAIALLLGLIDDDSQAIRLVKLALLEVDPMLGSELTGSVKPELHREMIALIEALETPEWYKVELLGVTKLDAAIPLLCQALNSNDLDICRRVCQWLVLFENQSAIKVLQQKLAKLNELLRQPQPFLFPNPILQCWEHVIKALAQISKQDAIQDLRHKLLESPNPSGLFTRLSDGITLLAQLDGKNCLPKLFEMIEDQTSPNRQKVAASTLGKIDDESALSKLIQRLGIEQNSSVRESIINSLALSNTDEAALVLAKMMEDPNPVVRQSIAKKLIRQNNPVAVTVLQPLLNHLDSKISWDVAKVLGQLRSTYALPKLISVLTNTSCSADRRSTAAKLLGQIDDESAILILLDALVDPDYTVRRSAAISLRMFGIEHAVPELLKAFRHYHPYSPQNHNVQTSFLVGEQTISLEYMPDEDLQILGDKDTIHYWVCEHGALGRIQMEIAEALDHLGTEAAIKGLFEGLNYPIRYSDESAAIVLGKRGRKEAIPKLLELLKDIPAFISANTVIEVLASLADEEVVAELIEILQNIERYANSDYYLRNRAAIVLERIQGELTSKHLSKLKESIFATTGEQILWAIIGIQAQCGFYNYYEIAQSAKEEGSEKEGTGEWEVGSGEGTQVINNTYTIGTVGNLNTGKVTIHGNQIGEQYPVSTQSVEEINPKSSEEEDKPSNPVVKTILVLASSPVDMARLRLDKEVRKIEQALRRSQKRDQFKLEPKWAVRANDLRRALLDVQPQIVHFCGHGIGAGGLLLEDQSGQAKPVSTEALADLFALFADQIECVVLNACYSGKQAKAIVQHIPYVIGMQDAVGDTAAIEFATGFYDGLGGRGQEGNGYENAYKFGCNAIHLENLPGHLTPKLLKKSDLTS